MASSFCPKPEAGTGMRRSPADIFHARSGGRETNRRAAQTWKKLSERAGAEFQTGTFSYDNREITFIIETMTNAQPSDETSQYQEANKNPWYVLMTLHGQNHAKNRRDWNKFAARALSDAKRKELLEIKDIDGNFFFDSDELTPHNLNDFKALSTAFENAAKNSSTLADLDKYLNNFDFSATRFDNQFYAKGFLFTVDVNLSESFFSNPVDFSEAVFCNDTNFTGTIFSNISYFSRAVFLRRADFSKSNFKKETNFELVHFHGYTYFNKATFLAKINFINTIFARPISFAGANFMAFPPAFHEAKLHSDSDWYGAQWPKPSQDYRSANEHVRDYQCLKQIMETLKKHEDELNFFAMEMKAQRVVDGQWSPRWILNGLYDALCDYGRSIARPMWAFFPLFAFSAPIFEQSARNGEGCAPLSALEAAGVSVATLLSVLPGLKDMVNFKCLSTFATATAGINAVAGAILLFLIGLGLRNRFRMK